ncbi:uncharacterized protein LOC126687974 [Mercurialis annua]|uniref:uncharacterized protein LOC126687974 n=1 Tax=Mercurialis annua TaxID=3986 RepID=UPI00215F1E9A|nr:uncharacterized protein LOC126687974 [Mercurialis annua]
MDNMNSHTPSSEGISSVHVSSERSIRQKRDLAWKYISEGAGLNGKKILICGFCQKQICGGGINRMKQHLAGAKGNIDACKKVTADVRCEMKGLLEENVKKVNEKKGIFESNDNSTQESPSTGKRKANTQLGSYFKMGLNDKDQPSIKACMQSKERWHDVDMAIALWFYDACIPMNAVNSAFFTTAISKIAGMGHGYTGPSYHSLRVNLLHDAKQHVSLIIDSFRRTWIETGCTIMGDGWKDVRQRPLINFLVYCPKGITFLKSVDASDIYTNAETLCNLFAEIVEIVGHENVIHMVTDNGANYKAAGAKLTERYSQITWSPCAAHCVNLILKDVGEIPNVQSLATLASKVTVFVYNHKCTLNWLRKRPGWREIIRPGATRFATTFIALQSLYERKDHLHALVIDTEFKKFLKMQKGKEVKQIVQDGNFWNNCLMIVRIMGPIIRLLRICDTDEKPTLGYVYEGMYRARLAIKKLFKNRKTLYKPYTSIIKQRWDRMLRLDLHAAAYYLNPAFQYDQENFCKKPEIMRGLLNVIDKQNACSKTKMADELRYFRDTTKMQQYFCFSAFN